VRHDGQAAHDDIFETEPKARMTQETRRGDHGRRTKLISLVIMIAALTATVALLDVLTSAELVGAILFTLPLALCAVQPSRRLLRATAAAATILTVVAELWGVGRAELRDPWVASVNRGLVIISLATLTTIIHFSIKKNRRIELDGAKIELQRGSLLVQNEQLEVLVTDGAIVLVNVEAERQFGYLRDDLVGKRPRIYAAPSRTVVRW
jgi:PAS domain-containing protein